MIHDENLQSYLERNSRINKNLHPTTVKMPVEPRVKAVEKTLDIPKDVWDNEQYGRIDDLIEYVRQANHIPRNAALEVALDEASMVFRMHFQWWEITVLTERSSNLH